MNSVTLRLCQHFLPKLLAQPCERVVPRSGANGAAVNCFTVSIDRNSEPFLLVSRLEVGMLHCLTWDGSSYAIPTEVQLVEINPRSIFATHFYGLAEVRFFGILDLALGRTFFVPYIKIMVVQALSAFDQYLFNKKKLITKQRVDLLRFLVERKLDGQDKLGTVDLMTQLYSIKWVSHPDRDSQHRKLEVYLDSLDATGELKKISGYEYEVTGHALRTIEEYEEQERKHTENVKVQRRIFWLTLVVALFTAAQAGLLKFPTILDLSK